MLLSSKIADLATSPLMLHNTLGGEKVIFKPIKPGHIGLYVCGITVYDYCHIGHARVLITFDIIVRFLRSQGWQVHYVRNITDVDDKIIARAQKNNEPMDALVERFIQAMHEDEDALGILRPDQEPRATHHIGDIIDMIKTLEEKGFAYKASNGDVYYKVSEFTDYGKLSNINIEQLLENAGERLADTDSEPLKKDPRDFALWKASADQDNAWDSPWGWGRPGWHIECSAMSKQCLGEHFDIHGGGPDLRFPHHENEIAQSEAANGCTMANYWMHAGAVRVDGEKMSKSLDNFFTIREVLKQYHSEVIRFLMISSHYRSHISYSEENLSEAKSGLSRFYHGLKAFESVLLDPIAEPATDMFDDCEYYVRFVQAMNDDFNTREALSVMYEMVNRLNVLKADDINEASQLAQKIKALGNVLGILSEQPNTFLQAGLSGLSADDVEAKIAERQAAKLAKNYQLADDIRKALTEQGVILEDSASGTTWRRENE